MLAWMTNYGRHSEVHRQQSLSTNDSFSHDVAQSNTLVDSKTITKLTKCHKNNNKTGLHAFVFCSGRHNGDLTTLTIRRVKTIVRVIETPLNAAGVVYI